MRLDFLIRRRGIDPAAESALHALRDLMHVAVLDVERGTLWRFDVDDGADPLAVREALERAACRAGRYVNTNRDECLWLDVGAAEPAERAGVGCAVSLWITRADGHDAVARDYFQSRVAARLNTVRRGTFYRLWCAEVESQRALELVEGVAVARTRRQGLLLNPHHERLEVLEVTLAANEAEAR
jgi:hypothetical protein